MGKLKPVTDEEWNLVNQITKEMVEEYLKRH